MGMDMDIDMDISENIWNNEKIVKNLESKRSQSPTDNNIRRLSFKSRVEFKGIQFRPRFFYWTTIQDLFQSKQDFIKMRI